MAKIDYEALIGKCRENLRAGKELTLGLTSGQSRALMNRYSQFSDTLEDSLLIGSEMVVKTLRQPRPYLHMMGSTHDRLTGLWGSLWDPMRGGFSCLDSVLAGKMTSHLDNNYVPTNPEVQDVRDFYVHEAGKAWPMFPVAGYEENRYRNWQCRMGLDTYFLQSERAKLQGSLLVHVPVDEPLEVWELSVKNASDRARKFSWFARIKVNVDSYPFYYFVPRVVCEGLLENEALVFLNHDQNNKHPRQAFLTANQAFDGYDMMSEVFDGNSPRAPIPAAVARGQCFNSPGLQPHAGLIAAVQFDAELAPGQSKTWTLAYGTCTMDAAVRKEFIGRIKREIVADPEASRRRLADRWKGQILANAIATPDEHLNRYYNVWSKFQSRTQSRFCRGLDKMGYRDVMQDLLGLCDFDPSFTKNQLADALQYQFADGRAVRQYEKFKGGGHDMRMYQDSPIWIPDTLIRYVKETGDVGFLEKAVPYLDDQTLRASSTEQGTTYDHAVRAMQSVYLNTGYHGLCKIGYGDWNDALSRIGGEKGVSVWLSCACVYACKLMAELADFLGKADDAQTFRQVALDMTGRINEHAWDGQWYIYAINYEGKPIGSSTSNEGKLHLNVNTWAIFSGVAAAANRQEQVWQAVQKLATSVGHVLLAPPYTLASRDMVGRIADCLPGQFENGSIYTHGESFYLYALVRAGQSDRWLEEISKTLPTRLVPDISSGPPHQQSNYFVGPAHPGFGQNLFSNFTGSLAWYRRGIEAVCGILPDFAGLRVAPQPPKAWKSYRVVKSFRGCQVDCRLKRGAKASIKLDGKEVGALIPASEFAGKTQCTLEVTYT